MYQWYQNTYQYLSLKVRNGEFRFSYFQRPNGIIYHCLDHGQRLFLEIEASPSTKRMCNHSTQRGLQRWKSLLRQPTTVKIRINNTVDLNGIIAMRDSPMKLPMKPVCHADQNVEALAIGALKDLSQIHMYIDMKHECNRCIALTVSL